MFSTKKINENTVAVIYYGADNASIALRKSGKAYFGTEEDVVHFEKNELIVNKSVAAKYGIKIKTN